LNIIKLTRNTVAVVDDEDFARLSSKTWCCSSGGYATRKNGNKTEYMHKTVVGETILSVDHINGDKLDNRKQNLRICSHSENTKNRSKSVNKSSKYKGVNFDSKSGKWRARIKVEYKETHLGFFVEEKQAAMAYDKAALQYFGKYAKLNFKESLYV